MHPWVAEQLVESRMAERRDAASESRRSSGSYRSDASPVGGGVPRTPRAHRPHRTPARLVGSLLIGAGRRLAGPDALAAALDASRIEQRRSPA